MSHNEGISINSIPVCSIIMPCYNVEQYLVRAIESVLKQSFKDFELLVVIDGSPDNSQTIAESYARSDDRVKVLIKENGGVSSARNFGLKLARGKYIYFMDPDDWVCPNLLEKNIFLLEKEKSDIVIFGLYNMINGIFNSKLQLPNKKISRGDCFSLGQNELKAFGYGCNKIYKKKIIDKNNLWFNESLALWEDCVFNFNYINCAKSYVMNSECFYFYNIYEGSASHKSHSDYTNYIAAYKKSALDYINVYRPKNKKQALVFIYALFLDVFSYELSKSKNELFEKQFDYYYSKVKDLGFTGLKIRKLLAYHATKYRLHFLLKIYRKLIK